MNPKLYVCAFVFSILIFACSDSNLTDGSHHKLAPEDISILTSVLEKGPGQKVAYRDAELCIDAFAKKMEEFGIVENPREPPYTLAINGKQKITQRVVFGGPELSEWIVSTVKNEMGKETGSIDIRVEFGIYNDAFLNTYRNHSIQDPKNRITVFLVPYRNGKKIKMNPADSVFNLGGLQP